MNEQVKVLKRVELLGHQLTIYGAAGNPLFLAKEVANIILDGKVDKGAVARITKPVNYFEKGKFIFNNTGKKQALCMLTLSGGVRGYRLLEEVLSAVVFLSEQLSYIRVWETISKRKSHTGFQ